MNGTELIKKIKELGEDKEIIIQMNGSCEGVWCRREEEIDSIYEDENATRINGIYI